MAMFVCGAMSSLEKMQDFYSPRYVIHQDTPSIPARETTIVRVLELEETIVP